MSDVAVGLGGIIVLHGRVLGEDAKAPGWIIRQAYPIFF